MPPLPAPFLTRRATLGVLAGALPAAAAKAQTRAQDIVVITSFPASFYEPFRAAFEAAQGEFRLRILNRKTTAALALVADERLPEADIFWASAPDAFEVLKARGMLLPLTESATTPGARVQGYPIDDADGLFRGFSISGYGLMWNRERLAALGLTPPVSVAQLTDPAYRGLIAMSAPSRSGTTHLMVETILQRYGWERGWSMWLQIAANLANVAARSFSVVSGVAQGRYAIGLSIDFLGRGSGAASGVGFVYPTENVFLPASIALLRTGRNAAGARRFAQFVLSEAGQRLLITPAIQRQPVMRKVAAAMAEPALLLSETDTQAPSFDAIRSGRRYELVNVIFDELVTDRLLDLQRLWRGIATLAALAPTGSAEAVEIAAIEQLAAKPPDAVLALDGREPELRRVPRGSPLPAEQAQIIDAIRTGAEQRLQEATSRLNQLANRLAPGAPGAMPRLAR